MNEAYQAYFDFLAKLGEELERLTKLTKEKAAAVRRDDLIKVNDCIKKEQAIGMTLRSMDKKREKMLAELGLEGVPLSGLAQKCPSELYLQAKEVSARLSNQYALYRCASEVTRHTLECNLHQIEKIIEQKTNGEGFDTHRNRLADIRA